LITDIGMTNATTLREPKSTFHTQLLLMAALFGVLMGIIFIAVQPWFGMDTLTSRHAAAYQQLGHWSSVPALTIAWVAHLAVSIFYGVLSGIVILKTSKVWIITLFTLAFSWLTTVIAPPANAMIVQLVSFQQLQIDQLPSLNFSLDIKFVLHLVFFAAITIALYFYKQHSTKKDVV